MVALANMASAKGPGESCQLVTEYMSCAYVAKTQGFQSSNADFLHFPNRSDLDHNFILAGPSLVLVWFIRSFSYE